MEENKKKYTNFDEIWADYPQCDVVMLQIDPTRRHFGTKKIAQALSIAQYNPAEFSYVYATPFPQWEHIVVEQSVNWLEELTKQNRALVLVLDIRNHSHEDVKAEKTIEIPYIPQLAHLWVSVYASERTNLRLAGSPDLAFCKISNSPNAIVERVGEMPRLALFQVLDSPIADLPALLACLNPQTLENLSLQKVKKSSFFPTKGKKGTPADLSIMESFAHLKRLVLKENNLESLPFSLANFRVLAHLDLSYNKLTIFPSEILQLPTLQNLDIAKTDLAKSKYIRTGKEIISLIGNLEKGQASPEDRKKVFALLTQGEAALEDANVGELYKLAMLAKNEIVRKNALILCQKKTPNCLANNAEIQRVALVGKTGLDLEQINEALAERPLHLSEGIAAETQAICIGDKLSEKEWKALINNTLPVCFPEHIRGLLHQEQDLYLTEIAPDLSKNFDALLTSNDSSSVLLALKMMENGGLPDLVLEYLCYAYLKKYVPCREEKLALIEKYATASQIAELKRLAKTAFPKKMLALFESPLFSQRKFVEMTIKYLMYDINAYKNDSFLYYWRGFMWRATGEVLDIWLKYLTQDDGTLRIDSTNYKLDTFPRVLSENPHIKKMALHEWYVTTASKKIIESMPHLHTLEIMVSTSNAKIFAEHQANYTAMFPKIAVSVTRAK